MFAQGVFVQHIGMYSPRWGARVGPNMANHLVQTRLGPTMAAGERMLLQDQLVNTFEYNVLHVYTTTLAHGSPLAPAPLRFHRFLARFRRRGRFNLALVAAGGPCAS